MNPGETFEHYRIDSVVSCTTMATLFRATDLDNGIPVALKILNPERECDVTYYDRFRREQKIARKLVHPSVVRAVDGADPDSLYIAFEWVEGRSLRKLIEEQKKLPLARAIKIALNILEALEYVHEQGVVHRDLKPENVMIVDAEDHIKLIDFGIASWKETRRLTFGNFSKIMGTPDYISPEQMKGSRGDARSDLYSLGVMLYEMLTGTVPFNGDDPLVVMNDRLLNNVMPASEIEPSVTPQLQQIIQRALERDPKLRYPGAKQLSWDLKNPDRVQIEPRTTLQETSAKRPWWSKAALLGAIFVLFPFLMALLLELAPR